jgi:hypothetical protein
MHNKNLDNHLFTKKELIAWLNDLLQVNRPINRSK